MCFPLKRNKCRGTSCLNKLAHILLEWVCLWFPTLTELNIWCNKTLSGSKDMIWWTSPPPCWQLLVNLSCQTFTIVSVWETWMRCGLRTSSVIRVAMERPISWYCRPFPNGPSSRKRNLDKKMSRLKIGQIWKCYCGPKSTTSRVMAVCLYSEYF